jgi:hypothetical protein
MPVPSILIVDTSMYRVPNVEAKNTLVFEQICGTYYLSTMFALLTKWLAGEVKEGLRPPH